jgi:hypothetical protein
VKKPGYARFARDLAFTTNAMIRARIQAPAPFCHAIISERFFWCCTSFAEKTTGSIRHRPFSYTTQAQGRETTLLIARKVRVGLCSNCSCNYPPHTVGIETTRLRTNEGLLLPSTMPFTPTAATLAINVISTSKGGGGAICNHIRQESIQVNKPQ